MTRRRRIVRVSRRGARHGERGVALILAILVIFILTVMGLALLFSTATEFQLAGAETTVNKSFYAADSGSQYGVYQVKASTFTPNASQACTSATTYFCFQIPERSASGTDRSMSVKVSPINLVNRTESTVGGGSLNVSEPTKVVTKDYSFTATSTDSTLNTQKTISVIVTLGPVPE